MTTIVHAKVVLYTYAEGLMSRLAHDLALEAVADEAKVLEETETGGVAELVFSVAKIEILGAVKKGEIDPAVLSGSDRRDIGERMSDAIGPGEIRAHVTALGGQATIGLVLPCGSATVKVPLEKDGTEYTARARFSLKDLGVKPVRGPLNAFRLSDRLDVDIRAEVRRAASQS